MNSSLVPILAATSGLAAAIGVVLALSGLGLVGMGLIGVANRHLGRGLLGALAGVGLTFIGLALVGAIG